MMSRCASQTRRNRNFHQREEKLCENPAESAHFFSPTFYTGTKKFLEELVAVFVDHRTDSSEGFTSFMEYTGVSFAHNKHSAFAVFLQLYVPAQLWPKRVEGSLKTCFEGLQGQITRNMHKVFPYSDYVQPGTRVVGKTADTNPRTT